MDKTRVSILVVNGFVATELALALDVLRIANRLNERACFDIRVCTSSSGDLIDSMDGVLAVRAEPFAPDAAGQPHHVLVLGGRDIRLALAGLCAPLRWLERMGGHILLLSDAASEWKRLHPESGTFTTHWENQQLLRDTLVDLEERSTLYARSGRITTAAGMIATADVVLSTVVASVSPRLAHSTGRMLVMDGIREGGLLQPRSENDNPSLRLAKLDAVIRHMEEHVESPVDIKELARVSGTSIRQLERKFQKAIGRSPVEFYRSLRLRRGKVMVEQTAMPISQIAVASGFNTDSGFSRVFYREFGTTPTQLRRQIVGDASHTPKLRREKAIHNAPVTFPAPPSGTSAHTSGTDGAIVQRAWR